MEPEIKNDRRRKPVDCAECREDLISRSGTTRNWLIGLLVILALAGATQFNRIGDKVAACADETDMEAINTALTQIANDQRIIRDDIGDIKGEQKAHSSALRGEIDRSKDKDNRHDVRLDRVESSGHDH